jgi:tryptophan synthase beta chain
MSETKIILSEQEIPKHWYNILPDMPSPPAPPLHPGTGKPVGPDDLKAIFPMSLIEQEMSGQREIAIPDEVREIYALWRPSPLFRAKRLERALKTPARIYYKYEGNSPAGSHKPNTAVPQAYYNKDAGIRRIATETGAGQWGSAMALACQMFGLECTVYMVKVSYEQKPYRRSMMATWGAEVIPSPSNRTNSGRAMLAAHPDSTGARRGDQQAVGGRGHAAGHQHALGSVLNHVLLPDGDRPETKAQPRRSAKRRMCSLPRRRRQLRGFTFRSCATRRRRPGALIATEPKACPTLTRGSHLRLRRHRAAD